MSNRPMEGVRVLEVAQYTFTPAAGAVMADWGADVIKVEHAVTGDAQRGIKLGTGGAAAGSFQPLMEHPNRGKRSIGLALETAGGRAVLDRLIVDSDVFLTNFLPGPRQRLRIDVDDVRAVNPDIIYARGSAFGPEGRRGRRRWLRPAAPSGVGPGARTARPPATRGTSPSQPAGAYGDSIGGMTIAGGIAAALFERERTGRPSVVDVSLLSMGIWATALSVSTSMLLETDMPRPTLDSPPNNPVNPIIGTFRTADGRFVNLTMLQPGRYWADVCRHIGRDDLIDDDRFDSAEKLMANAGRGRPATSPMRSWRSRTPTGSSASPPSRGSGRRCRARSRWPPIRRSWPTATC